MKVKVTEEKLYPVFKKFMETIFLLVPVQITNLELKNMLL